MLDLVLAVYQPVRYSRPTFPGLASLFQKVCSFPFSFYVKDRGSPLVFSDLSVSHLVGGNHSLAGLF